MHDQRAPSFSVSREIQLKVGTVRVDEHHPIVGRTPVEGIPVQRSSRCAQVYVLVYPAGLGRGLKGFDVQFGFLSGGSLPTNLLRFPLVPMVLS